MDMPGAGRGETPALSNPAMRQEEWLALEAVYYSGAARSIGVSHYCSTHLDDVMAVATVTPSVNQVEYHVGSGDVDHVMDKCAEIGTYFMSYSPLCGPCTYTPSNSLIDGDLVSEIASHYPGVTGSQVIKNISMRPAAAAAAAAFASSCLGSSPTPRCLCRSHALFCLFAPPPPPASAALRCCGCGFAA